MDEVPLVGVDSPPPNSNSSAPESKFADQNSLFTFKDLTSYVHFKSYFLMSKSIIKVASYDMEKH